MNRKEEKYFIKTFDPITSKNSASVQSYMYLYTIFLKKYTLHSTSSMKRLHTMHNRGFDKKNKTAIKVLSSEMVPDEIRLIQ